MKNTKTTIATIATITATTFSGSILADELQAADQTIDAQTVDAQTQASQSKTNSTSDQIVTQTTVVSTDSVTIQSQPSDDSIQTQTPQSVALTSEVPIAETQQSNLVGSVDSIDIQEDGQTSKGFSTYQNIKVNTEFHVADGEAHEGDQTVIQLPELLKFQNDSNQSVELRNDADVHFADALLDVDNRSVNITYNKNVEGLMNIKGGLSFYTNLVVQYLSKPGITPLKFTINGQTEINKEIQYIGADNAYAINFQKVAWQNATGNVTTNITIGKDGKTYSNMVLTDDIDPESEDNVEYDYSSLKVWVGKWVYDDITGWKLDADENIADKVEWLAKNKGDFKFRIPSEYNNKGVLITYISKYISPVNEGETINNKAILEADTGVLVEWPSYASILNINGWIKGEHKPEQPNIPDEPKDTPPAPDTPEEPKTPSPETPEEPGKDEAQPHQNAKLSKTENKNSMVGSNAPKEQNEVKLPSTGSQTNNYYLGLGVVVLIMAMILYYKIKKDDK